MPPVMQQLFDSTEFWTSILIALIGGSGLGGVVGAWASRRKSDAEALKLTTEAEQLAADADRLAAEAAKQAVNILNSEVVTPLREQLKTQRDELDYAESQIAHLEESQRKGFKVAAYTRSLCHWLQQYCEEVDPEFLARHPKPRLPDDLRPDIAPETIKPTQGGGQRAITPA